MKFRLKSGSYCDGDGIMHHAKTPSAIIESNTRLDKKYRNKFEFVHETGQVSSSPLASAATQVVTDAKSADAALAAAKELVENAEANKAEIEAAVAKGAKDILPVPTKPATPLGMNVTALFKAEESKFTIHKNGAAYDVAKDGVKVNPDPLTKDVVLMYLKNNA
jgi:hypothetical protein